LTYANTMIYSFCVLGPYYASIIQIPQTLKDFAFADPNIKVRNF